MQMTMCNNLKFILFRQARTGIIKENGINYWPPPAESPDLNPIEMIWHELKHHYESE